MVNMSLDIANNLLTFILSAFTICGSIVSLIAAAVLQKFELARVKEEVKELRSQQAADKVEQENNLVRVEEKMVEERIRMEGKFDAVQVMLTQLLQAVGEVKGELKYAFRERQA